MERNPQVLVQIQRIEVILKESGLNSYCTACVHSPEGGCCQGCQYLAPTGCTVKPLACALWLCGRAQRAFPETHEQLVSIAHQWPRSLTHGYRGRSLIAESELNNVNA